MSRLLELLASSQEKFAQYGWLGVVAYSAAMVLLQIFIIPLSPVGIAAGAGFGFWKGWIAVTLGTNTGGMVNFFISRHLARGFITRRLGSNEKFRLIDAAIAREGWKMVALLRFCPIPFGLANYAFGLTGIAFLPYAIASFFATIPANTFIVWLGASAGEGLAAATGAQRTRHPGEYVFLAVGLIAFFLVLRHITKLARAAVAKVDAPAAE